MRFRSTGLGKTELKGDMSSLSPKGEQLLVFTIQTYEPVEWCLRAGIEPTDVGDILKGVLKPSVFFLIAQCLFFQKRNPKEPEDIMDKSITP